MFRSLEEIDSAKLCAAADARLACCATASSTAAGTAKSWLSRSILRRNYSVARLQMHGQSGGVGAWAFSRDPAGKNNTVNSPVISEKGGFDLGESWNSCWPPSSIDRVVAHCLTHGQAFWATVAPTELGVSGLRTRCLTRKSAKLEALNVISTGMVKGKDALTSRK